MKLRSKRARAVFAGLAVMATVATGSGIAGAESQGISAQDQAFLDGAGHAIQWETLAGHQEFAKMTNFLPTVYAYTMVVDHSALDADLAVAAQAAGGTVPSSPTADGTLFLSLLDGVPAPDADCAYLAASYTEHTQSLALFQNEADNGDNAELTALASATVPKLQFHLWVAGELLLTIPGC
jgi:putative membrane protein